MLTTGTRHKPTPLFVPSAVSSAVLPSFRISAYTRFSSVSLHTRCMPKLLETNKLKLVARGAALRGIADEMTVDEILSDR